MTLVEVRDVEEMTVTELAEEANEAAVACEEASANAVHEAIRCGEALLVARKKVTAGHWEHWVGENFMYSSRHARRFMDMAANRTRVSGALSLRQALDLLASLRVKKEVVDTREEKVVELLMKGMTVTQIHAELKMCKKRMSQIYFEKVVPELLKVNWREGARSAPNKELYLARNTHAVLAEYRHRKMRGGIIAWMQKEIPGFRSAYYDACRAVFSEGSPALVSRLEAGTIPPTTAQRILRLPQEMQLMELGKTEHKRSVSPVDELRSRISTLFDQKQGWQNAHGTSQQVFVDIAQQADADELRSLVSCLESVSEWASTVARTLGR